MLEDLKLNLKQLFLATNEAILLLIYGKFDKINKKKGALMANIFDYLKDVAHAVILFTTFLWMN